MPTSDADLALEYAMPDTPTEKFHHFVSRMQLKRFADASGRLQIWNKRAGKLLRQAPEKAFGQTHLYTTERANGQKDTWFEKELSKLETTGDALLAKIEEAASQGLAPSLNGDEKAQLDFFFYTAWKRVPDFFDNADSIKNADELFDRTLAELRQQYPDKSAELDRLDTPEQRKRLLQEGKILGIASPSQKILSIIASRGLMVLQVPPGNPGFVIGSMPIARTRHPLTDHRSEAWLPISPQLLIGPGLDPGSINLAEFDPAGVEQVNLAIARQSTMYAGPDPEQIEALSLNISKKT